MDYPALKAVVDSLIAQGYGDASIAKRVKTHRNLLRHPCENTIRMYRRYLAEQQRGAQAEPPVRPVMNQVGPPAAAPINDGAEANPMERAPAGQAQEKPLDGPADDEREKKYLTPVEMLALAALTVLPHLGAQWKRR